MRSGVFQGVWEQIIYVYWPHRARSRALLTGPEADVHFGDVAGERFSGIIKVRGEATVELKKPLTKKTAVEMDTLPGSVPVYTYTQTHTSAHMYIMYGKSSVLCNKCSVVAHFSF